MMDVTIFMVIIILSEIILILYVRSVEKRRIIDDKVLEENVRNADPYELAYLKRGVFEVYALIFYMLIKSGYLIQKEKKGKGALYYRDKNKSLEGLRDIEKMMLLYYEDTLSYEELDEKLESIFERYRQKIESLHLYAQGIFFRGVGLPLIIILFSSPFFM